MQPLQTRTQMLTLIGQRTVWLLGGVLVLAVAVRLYGLASLPVYQDELYTLHDAQDFPERFNFPRPVYYALQHVLLGIFPATPFFLRLPPFLFGVAGVWLTWALGRQVFGSTAGLVAALLVALSQWHVYASQFARYWTLVYALAAATYMLLLRSNDADRPGLYIASLATLIVGTLTHPTFAFPMVGVLLALLVVRRDGRVGALWPSARAWLFLWGPLALLGIAGFVMLMLGDVGGSGGGRDLAANLRLVPAIVQWAGPVVVATAGVGILFHLQAEPPRDRRWGIFATLGCLACLTLLLAASPWRTVYADYAMSVLPLLFVSVGGVIQRVSERLAPRVGWFVPAATLVMLAGVLPGTVSHMSDGTRFDYGPAYAHIMRAGGDRHVIGWPATIQRYYAPGLSFEEFRADSAFLAETAVQTSGFWLISSHRRRGMIDGTSGVTSWMNAHCRRVLMTERPRIDYRTYRVELHWCGDDAIPTGAPLPAAAKPIDL